MPNKKFLLTGYAASSRSLALQLVLWVGIVVQLQNSEL